MLQGPEIIIILLVALVVLGPQRLPEIARKIGRWTNELRRAAGEMRAGLEAEVKEIKDVAEEFEKPVREMKSALEDTARLADDKRRWVGPQPKSGPKPAEAMDDLHEIEEKDGPITDRPDHPTAEAG